MTRTIKQPKKLVNKNRASTKENLVTSLSSGIVIVIFIDMVYTRFSFGSSELKKQIHNGYTCTLKYHLVIVKYLEVLDDVTYSTAVAAPNSSTKD